MLYIVPTPIGNLEDITLRALRILKESDLILAEDTRTSGFLLKHYDISTPLGSFHAFNEHKSLNSVIQKLQSGTQIALISDAGTPGISDPGFLLVRACLENGVDVSCLPGATAFVPALVSSGLSCDRFHFEGFLPHKKGRQTKWKFLSNLDLTIVLYESPYRLVKCLEEICLYLGADRKVCVAREISKHFEDIRTDSSTELLKHYQNHQPKGEIVVVIDAKQDTKKTEKPE
ncbi:MAG: 16S rRNA (cytidine(1402)-2'-O)-methyltransferase [Saprospiraceae bacterium]